MDKEQFVDRIESVFVKGKPYGLEAFAVLKVDGNLLMKKFLTTDALNLKLSSIIKDAVYSKYLAEDIELETSSNISDNRKNSIYDIEISDGYDPFSIISDYRTIVDQYDQDDATKLSGFIFRANFNDNHFWAYQHVYPMKMLKKSHNVYAIIGKNKTYDELDKDIIAIGERIDLIIMDNHIITGNIALLQSKFGFEKYIRQEAMQAIDIIVETGLITDSEILLKYSSKEKLTNAKKLMKAKNSPVLLIEKTELINRIGRHTRYSSMIKIKNKRIQLKSEKDVNSFIKLLNDDIVRSELTEAEYDSVSKKILDPIE